MQVQDHRDLMWTDEDGVLPLVLSMTARTADAPGIGVYQITRRHISKTASNFYTTATYSINEQGKQCTYIQGDS